MMRRMPVVAGILGLLCAAVLPAGAQQTVQLFGKTYNVVCESRAQTFKNGKAVVLPDAGNRKANLDFVLGSDPSLDRLFVVAPITADESVTGHQFYALVGADANGMFTKTSAELIEFWGGNQNLNRGGRPISVKFLNEVNTGTKVDRNLAITTFTDDDTFRYYDLDSLSTNFADDAVFSVVQRAINADEGDPNAPFGGFVAYADGPRGTLVAFGRPESGSGVEISVTDPRTDKFFPVLTNLGEVTADATTPFPQEEAFVHSAFLHSGDPSQGPAEYWLLVSSSQPDGDNDDTESNAIYRIRLTFPADLANAQPGSIRAEVLGTQELKGTALAGASPGGMFGMAKGRERTPGAFTLYFADWQGNLCTAVPQ